MTEHNAFLKSLLVFILPSILFMTLVSYWVVDHQHNSDIETLVVTDKKLLLQAQKTIELSFNSVFNDIQFLRKSSYLQTYIQKTTDNSYRYALDNLTEFMGTRINYAQLRYLDIDGNEKIRLVKNGLDIIDEGGTLQNKSSRYYYKRAQEINDNQVYISPLDLNVENGQVERPVKPVMRFIMPVANKEKIRQGYIVINIDMRNMLSQLREHTNAAGKPVWIMNSNRIWSIAPQGVVEWYDSSENDNYRVLDDVSLSMFAGKLFDDPLIENSIQKGGSMLSYHRLDTVPGLDEMQINKKLVVTEDYPWLLFSYIPDVDAVSFSGALIGNIIRINILLALIILFAGFLIARNESRATRSRGEFLNEKLLLNNFFENAPFSLYTKNVEGQFTHANPVSIEIMGREKSQIIGKTVDDIYPANIADKISSHDCEVLTSSKPIEFEEIVKDANNNDMHFLSSKFPIYDHEHKIVGIGGISSNVTALREFENKLDDKERRFQGIFNHAHQFIWLLDTEGKVLEANNAALEFAALLIDDVLGQYFWSTFWWNYSEKLSKAAKEDIKLALNDFLVRKECRIRGKGDAYLDIDLTIRSIADEDDEVIYLIAEGRDITQIVKDRFTLEKNYMYLDAINAFQKGIINQSNARTSFNMFLSKILKLTNSEYGFIGEILHDGDKPYLKTHAISDIAWNDETRKIFDDNVENGLEFRSLDNLFGSCVKSGQTVLANDPANDARSGGLPDGHPEMNSFLGLPVYFNDVMVGMIGIANRPGGYSNDMTEELDPLLQTCGQAIHTYQGMLHEQKMEAALKESEERMRALIDAAPDGLLMVDSNGVIRLINSQVEVLLGYTRHELISSSIELIVPDDIKQQHPSLREKYLINPATRTMQFGLGRREIYARHKDGHSVPIEIGLSPLRMDDEMYVIASMRDVSERKRLDSQLMQSQKMESVGKLTGGIAHDFNNFLGVIIGNLDLLSHFLGDDKKAKARVEKATSAALRGAELTKRLLAFSRRQTLAPKPTNMNQVIEGMTEIIERTLGSDISISKHLIDNLWMCNVDPHQLENVILNMAINARDAMPDGGKLIITTCNKVMHSASQEVAGGEVEPGNYVVLEITDTGMGISKTDQDKIFEPFFTTKEEGKGTGLGLAMVYGFVKQSTGYIKLYSELGHGSSFSIYLPRIVSDDNVMEEELEDREVADLTGHGKILVVDDEELLLDVTAGQLEAAGYETISAKNASEALVVFSQNPDIDMLFTDIIMPGELNGVQLANKIQQQRPDIKVLLTSGFPKQALDGKKGKADTYKLLNKPYRETEMLDEVKKILNS